MLTRFSPKVLLFSAATSVLVGCAQTGPILPGSMTYGTLKTSLSHLEFENQQLRTKMSRLEAENREIENQLVQEENINGDLTARLDNARNLLSDRGYDMSGSTASAGTTPRDVPPGDEARSRALPAGRSTRKPRKPPFARIPGRIDSGNPADDTSTRPTIPSSDAFGPQSWQDDNSQWLPIASGTKEPAAQVR
jgi:hypothetical protein